MSTKTLRKRIALASVVALVSGLVSVAPANAALSGSTTLSCTVSLEASAAATSCTGAVGGQVKVKFVPGAAGTYYVTASNSTILAVADTEGTAATTTAAVASAKTNGVDYTQGWKAAPAAGNVSDGDYYVTTLTSASAGTTTFNVTTYNATTGVSTVYDTASILWASSSSLDPSPAYSSSILWTGATLTAAGLNTAAPTADSTVIKSGLTAGTLVGIIKVTAKDGNGNLLADGKTVVATVSGPGLAGGTATDKDSYANAARWESVTLAGGTGLAYFGIYSDGTIGTSTITITSGTTTLATETVKFFGNPTKVTVTQNLKVLSSAGAAINANGNTAAPTGADVDHTPAVTVKAVDVNGTPVSGLTVTAVSSSTSVVSDSVSCTESSGAGAGDNYAGAGSYNCVVTSVANTSGKSATLAFRVPDGITSGVYVSATPVSFTLGGSADKLSLALDKSSYTIGAPATATITVKDSAGNAAYDKDWANILSSASGLSSSLSLAKTLFGATTVSTIDGKSSVSFNAPTVATSWTISGTSGAGLGTDVAKAISATATVTSANDAQIASLIAKINALSKLIAKIQKKLGVK